MRSRLTRMWRSFDGLNDAWRKDVFDYVARLVRFRTVSDALSVNDVAFIHTDFNDGKRVVAWRRGLDLKRCSFGLRSAKISGMNHAQFLFDSFG